jgi:serine/threonine protein kinase
MISLDYKNRISAKDALKHPFFQENPLACEPSEVLPPEIRNPAPDTDYHEFITKNEKNRKQNFKKEFTFKHNRPEELTHKGSSITDLIAPSAIP